MPARRRRPDRDRRGVAAILVASIRLKCLETGWLHRECARTHLIACDSTFRKGDELGWFEHGSTIIVFAPDGFTLCENVRDGATFASGSR